MTYYYQPFKNSKSMYPIDEIEKKFLSFINALTNTISKYSIPNLKADVKDVRVVVFDPIDEKYLKKYGPVAIHAFSIDFIAIDNDGNVEKDKSKALRIVKNVYGYFKDIITEAHNLAFNDPSFIFSYNTPVEEDEFCQFIYGDINSDKPYINCNMLIPCSNPICSNSDQYFSTSRIVISFMVKSFKPKN